jgi:Penicillin-binding Protein dimerisation domain/PASTA domain
MARRSRLKTEDNRRRRVRFLLIFLLLLGGAAGIGTTYEQQLTNLIDIWRETFPAESRTLENDRGTIYDRNFKELAQTLERVSLYVRPREVKDIPETARILSELLALSEPEVIARMERDSHLVWLRRDIAQEDEEAVANLNLPGIYLHREVARNYPQQEYASHLIGYSENDLGLAGVEHYYNRLLNHDRVRQEDFPAIDLKGLEQTSTKGHDLVLTLDMKIQVILERYVKSLGEKMGNGRITSLLLDTRQGKIIAGASFPSYNPNSVWQHGNEILESLFHTPMVLPEEIRKFFRDASLLQGGWEQSTQVYPWSLVADKVDFGSQLRLWERLQLTTDLHVDFSGGKKQPTSLPQFEGTRQTADLGTVPKTATPLKVLLGMSHLLNGGKKIQPHILDRIMERPEQREYYYDIFHEESQGRNVFPSLVSRELQNLLRLQGKRGVLGSTALSGETVSLVMNEFGGSYVRDRMALIVIPAEQPEMILLLVSRDEELKVRKRAAAGYGSLSDRIDTILPSMVALQQVHRNLADMVEIADGEEQNFKGATDRESGKTENLTGMLEKQIKIMPDLSGLSLRKSLRLLQSAEVDVTVRGTGRIVSQSPKAGEKLEKGGRCILTLKIDAAPKAALQINDLQVKEPLSK